MIALRLLHRLTVSLAGAALLALGGCSMHFKPPDLGGLYNNVAQLDDLEREDPRAVRDPAQSPP